MACGLDRDSLEGFGLPVAASLPHLAVSLSHELLEVPLAPRLGDLALVLPQGRDLLVERRADVDQVVARRPERDPYLLDFVSLETFLEQSPKGPRIARVWVYGGHRGFADGKVVGMRAAHWRVQNPPRDVS